MKNESNKNKCGKVIKFLSPFFACTREKSVNELIKGERDCWGTEMERSLYNLVT